MRSGLSRWQRMEVARWSASHDATDAEIAEAINGRAGTSVSANSVARWRCEFGFRKRAAERRDSPGWDGIGDYLRYMAPRIGSNGIAAALGMSERDASDMLVRHGIEPRHVYQVRYSDIVPQKSAAPRSGRPCSVPTTTMDEARRMRRAGVPVSQIARDLGVNRTTVYSWLKEGE